MKIKLHLAKNKQYYFTINARNGQVIVTSETYKTTAGLLKGCRSIVKYMINETALMGSIIRQIDALKAQLKNKVK